MNRSPLNYLKSFIEQFKKSWRSSRNNPNDIVEIKERIRNPSPYNTWSYLPFLPQIGLILILKICFGIILLLCVSLGIIHLVTPYIEHGRDIVHDFFMSGIFPSWLVEHFQKQRPKPFEYVGHAFITTLSWATLALFGFKIRIYLPKNIGKYILPFSSNPHIPILSPICGFYSLVLLWFFLVIIFYSIEHCLWPTNFFIPFSFLFFLYLFNVFGSLGKIFYKKIYFVTHDDKVHLIEGADKEINDQF